MQGFLLLLLLVLTGPVSAQQILQVAVSEAAIPYEAAVAALYQQVGLVAQFHRMPSERAIKSTNDGLFDADLGRVVGGIQGYPNLMAMNEWMQEVRLVAIVKRGSKISALEPGAMRQYSYGLVRGAKMSESAVARLGLTADPANDAQQLFAKLVYGRFDVALAPSTVPIPPAYRDQTTALAAPVSTAKVVHVLNRKWADLEPRLSQALKTMKANGRWAKLLGDGQ